MSDIAPDISVEVETTPVEESEPAPPVVVVESGADEHGAVHEAHESRHLEHEARHDDIARLMGEGFDRIESSIESLSNRVMSVEERLAQNEQVTEDMADSVEEIQEEVEEDGDSEAETSSETEAIVTEPAPDIEVTNGNRSFLHRAWSGHGRD